MTKRSHRIVVGIDGSDASSVALDWAVSEAAVRGAPLEVVHAWVPTMTVTPEGVPFKEDAGTAEARAKQVLADAIDAALARATLVPDVIEPTLVRGVPAEVLEHRAADAFELVVGSHGLGAVAGALLGSVSEHCSEFAMTTVTVVPHRRSPLITDGPVVAGVDGSAESRNALRWAATSAGLRGAPLMMAHVFPPMSSALAEVAHEDALASAQTLLNDMEMTIRDVRPGPTAIEHLALPGHRRALIDAATGASMLVVGSRGHTGLRRLLGSFSRACTHHAVCPVTVVRSAAPRTDRA